MASVAQQIVDKIDALILAKLNGASDVSALVDRQLGQLGISLHNGIRTLTDIRDRYQEIADRSDPDATEYTTVVI